MGPDQTEAVAQPPLSKEQARPTPETKGNAPKFPNMQEFLNSLEILRPEDLQRERELRTRRMDDAESEEYWGILRRQEKSYVKENLPIAVNEMLENANLEGGIPLFMAIDREAWARGIFATRVYGPDDGDISLFPAFEQAVKEGRMDVIYVALKAKITQLMVDRDYYNRRWVNDTSLAETDTAFPPLERGLSREGATVNRRRRNATLAKLEVLQTLTSFLDRKLDIPSYYAKDVKWRDLLGNTSGTPTPRTQQAT